MNKQTHTGGCRTSIQEWIFGLFAMLMMTGATVFPNYSADTYRTFEHSSEAASDMLCRNGRPITALIYHVAHILRIEDISLIVIYTVLGFICLYLAIMLYEHSLRKYIKNDLIRSLVAALMICNLYIIEFFVFLEKVSFMLSILCAVIAYRYLQRIVEKDIDKRKWLYFSLSIVALIISTGCYQTTLSLFIVLLLPIILRPAYTWSRKIKWLLITVSMYGVAGCLNLGLLAVLSSFRTSCILSMGDRIIAFKRLITTFSFHTFDIVPFGFWFVSVAVFVVACLILARRSIGARAALIHLFILAAGVELCALIPFIMGVGWFEPRIIYVWACCPMLVVIFAFINGIFTDHRNVFRTFESKGLVFSLVCILLVQSIGFNQIYKDIYITNTLDKYRCTMIGEAIKKYEEDSGYVIKEIVFYEDAHLDEYHSLMHSFSSCRISSFSVSWGDLNAINYFLGTKYTRGKICPELANYFKNKNWEVYSDEQLVFNGSTLHICKY